MLVPTFPDPPPKSGTSILPIGFSGNLGAAARFGLNSRLGHAIAKSGLNKGRLAVAAVDPNGALIVLPNRLLSAERRLLQRGADASLCALANLGSRSARNDSNHAEPIHRRRACSG